MIDWIVNAIWSVLERLGGWFVSLFVWLFEFLYDLVVSFIGFILELVDVLIGYVLAGLMDLVPDDWVDTVTSAYSMLEYIDSWIPVSYGLKLFLAYYGIKTIMIPIKWTLKAIPTVWG